MNADIPYLRCWVCREYIGDGSGTEEAYAFGIQSVPGRALAFHVMLRSGAHYRGVPIHAILTTPGGERLTLGECQLWDCFTFTPKVHVFSYLREHQCLCRTRSQEVRGTYLFTVDWLPDSWEKPGFVLNPEQNKCAHVIEAEGGALLALPTNRIQWIDGYFIGDKGCAKNMAYRVQEDTYHAEDSGFDVSDTDTYAY